MSSLANATHRSWKTQVFFAHNERCAVAAYCSIARYVPFALFLCPPVDGSWHRRPRHRLPRGRCSFDSVGTVQAELPTIADRSLPSGRQSQRRPSAVFCGREPSTASVCWLVAGQTSRLHQVPAHRFPLPQQAFRPEAEERRLFCIHVAMVCRAIPKARSVPRRLARS